MGHRPSTAMLAMTLPINSLSRRASCQNVTGHDTNTASPQTDTQTRRGDPALAPLPRRRDSVLGHEAGDAQRGQAPRGQRTLPPGMQGHGPVKNPSATAAPLGRGAVDGQTPDELGDVPGASQAADAGETATVFRVQGGTPPLASRRLIAIDDDGNVRINRTTLNVSVGDPAHAAHFLEKRPGADIASFEIPKWMDNFIAEQAIPQLGYRTNPANQGGLAPKVVDPTTPGRSYELPGAWAEWLEAVAIPGSGQVTKGETRE